MAQTFKEIRRKDWAKQQSKLNHRIPLTLSKTWPKHNRQQRKPHAQLDITSDSFVNDDDCDLTSVSEGSHCMKPPQLEVLDPDSDFMPSSTNLDCYKQRHPDNKNNSLSLECMSQVLTEIPPCNVMTPFPIRLRHLSQGKTRRYDLSPDCRKNYLDDDDSFDSTSNSDLLLREFGAYCDFFFDHTAEKFDAIDPSGHYLKPETYSPPNVYATRKYQKPTRDSSFDRKSSWPMSDNAVVVEIGEFMDQIDDDQPLECPPRKPRTFSPESFSVVIDANEKLLDDETRKFQPSQTAAGRWSHVNTSVLPKSSVFDPHNQDDPFHIDEEINIDLETRSSSVFSFDQSTTLNTETTEQSKSYPSGCNSTNKFDGAKYCSSSDESSGTKNSKLLSSKLRRWRRDRNNQNRSSQSSTIRQNEDKSEESSGNSIELDYIDYPSAAEFVDKDELMTMIDDAIAQASEDELKKRTKNLKQPCDEKMTADAECIESSSTDTQVPESPSLNGAQSQSPPPMFEEHRPLRVFKFRDTIRKMKQVSSRRKLRFNEKDSVESFNNLPVTSTKVESTRPCKNKRARLWMIRNRLRR